MISDENHKDILIIGLTGGIGSGKSTVGRVFEALGVPRFDADIAGREIYSRNQDVRETVIRKFGDSVAVKDGSDNTIDINRSALAKIVFNQPEALKFISALIHPQVASSFNVWLSQLPENTTYVLREAAILFESGSNKDCHAVITVEADRELRKLRVAHRDSSDNSLIEAKMNSQWTDYERNKAADYVINNNDEASLLPQIQRLHTKFSKKDLK